MKKRSGFTIVEVMIVVVVIGLLAAMAIPAFQKVKENHYREEAKKENISVKEYRYRHKLMTRDEERSYRRDEAPVRSVYSSGEREVETVTTSSVTLPKELFIEGRKYRLVE